MRTDLSRAVAPGTEVAASQRGTAVAQMGTEQSTAERDPHFHDTYYRLCPISYAAASDISV